MVARVIGLGLLLCTMSGCITLTLANAIEDESASRNEFATVNDRIDGRYIGAVKVDGVRYDEYQFDDALTHPNGPRVLNLRVPTDFRTGNTAEAWETDYATLGRAAQMDITSDSTGVGYGDQWFAEHDTTRADIRLIALSLSDGQPMVYARLPTEEGALLTRGVPLHANLKWVKRSAAANFGRGLLFPLTAAADVATSPLQLVGYIVILNAFRHGMEFSIPANVTTKGDEATPPVE